jgi:hypothetical protein
MIEIEPLCRSQDGLGENPIWVAAERSLYWAERVVRINGQVHIPDRVHPSSSERADCAWREG